MNQPHKKNRVLVAEDHEIVRIGLRMLFDPQPDIDLIKETSVHDKSNFSKSRGNFSQNKQHYAMLAPYE